MCKILYRFFIIISAVFTLCSCGNSVIKDIPEHSSELEVTLQEEQKQTIETEYYKIHERLEGCKLYISNEKMCLQIPENAKVFYKGNISFIENGDVTQFSAQANVADALPEYQSAEDIIKSYENDGLSLKGELTGFRILYDNSGIKTGYEYLQEVKDVKKSYGILHRIFFKSGIMCSLEGTIDLNNKKSAENIRKYFNTVDVYSE